MHLNMQLRHSETIHMTLAIHSCGLFQLNQCAVAQKTLCICMCVFVCMCRAPQVKFCHELDTKRDKQGTVGETLASLQVRRPLLP